MQNLWIGTYIHSNIVIVAVQYSYLQMFSVCIDAPKPPSYYPKHIMLQLYICYHKNYYATWMLLEKLRHLNVL